MEYSQRVQIEVRRSLGLQPDIELLARFRRQLQPGGTNSKLKEQDRRRADPFAAARTKIY